MENVEIIKNKKKKIIIISIIFLMIVLIGGTFAYLEIIKSVDGEIVGKASCYDVNYINGQEISGELFVGDNYTGGKSTDIVIYSGNHCANMTGTLYITTNEDSTMDFSDKALRYTVVLKDKVVAEGAVTGEENQVIYTNFFLPRESTTFKVYIWLDSSLEDESNYIDETYSGFIHMDAKVPSRDMPANEPKLTDNLIPVYYDDTEYTWKTASYTNENNQWYDYDNKKWANAVLLNEAKRNEVLDDSGNVISGIEIGDTEADGTLAFYVWIPRYKYRVWNINKVIGVDSYNAQNEGIEIQFEHETNTTGTINCEYNFGVTVSETVRSEECTGENGDYYTHPAFTFGEDELTGFWMGKFELSSSSPWSSSTGGYEGLSLTPRILPNVSSWRSNYVDEYWKLIYDMQISNNEYGLTIDKTTTDTHLLTNLEWGAVAYLTHSKYGRCAEGVCEEVSINNSGIHTTYNEIYSIVGRSIGDSKDDYSGTYNYCGDYTYDGKLLTQTFDGTTFYCEEEATPTHVIEGTKASTTGNIYGVYDMSGGTMEYVMGNSSQQDTDSSDGITYLYYPHTLSSNAYYSYIGYEKYVTTYSYGNSHNDQKAYNRAKLGDATSEVALSSTTYWNNDFGMIALNSAPWFIRGGGFFGTNYRNEGIFASYASTGTANSYLGSRASLIVFNK